MFDEPILAFFLVGGLFIVGGFMTRNTFIKDKVMSIILLIFIAFGLACVITGLYLLT